MVTIHQPSSEIFDVFDQAIFLVQGRVFYQGPASQLSTYLLRFGYHCPENHNPADYILFVNQTVPYETLEEHGMVMSKSPSPIFDASIKDTTTTFHKTGLYHAEKADVLTQSWMLAAREFANVLRDKDAMRARFGSAIFLNCLIGLIFLNAGRGDNAIPSKFSAHFGAVTLLTVSSMLRTAQATLLIFPYERPLFLREYATGTCK